MKACHKYLIFLAVAFGIAMSHTPGGWAQDVKSPNIALLNYWQALRESKAGASLRQQIDAQRNKYQSEIETGQTTLEKLRAELAQQQGVLEPEALAKKRKEYQNHAEQLQQVVQNRKRQLDRMRQDGTVQIENVLREVLSALVKERGYDLVLNSDPKAGAVILSNSAMDLTSEVVKRLDAKMPAITVKPAE